MSRRTPSPAMFREAEKMAATRTGWASGRSKRNGREFWIIPSRENARRLKRGELPVAHWTAKDADGCTCRGYDSAGICTHTLAAQLVANAIAEADGSDGLASAAEIDVAFASVKADHEAVAEAERHLAQARAAGGMVKNPRQGTPVTRVPRTGGLQTVAPRASYTDLFGEDEEV